MSDINRLYGRTIEKPMLRRERSSDYNLFDPNFKIDVLNWCMKRCTITEKAEILNHLALSMNNEINNFTQDEAVIYVDDINIIKDNLYRIALHVCTVAQEIIENNNKKRPCIMDIMCETISEKTYVTLSQEFLCALVRKFKKYGYELEECSNIIYEKQITMDCGANCFIYELKAEGVSMFNTILNSKESAIV